MVSSRMKKLKKEGTETQDSWCFNHGEMFHCGSTLRIRGQLNLEEVFFATMHCFKCELSFNTESEKKKHNERHHASEAICTTCYQPVVDKEVHEFKYPPSFVCKIKPVGTGEGASHGDQEGPSHN